MSRFNAINLSGLNPPDVVEPLVFEDILAALVADFIARYPDYDLERLESDPAKKVLEVAAFRELILRARVNTAARAVLLAKAQQNDLDHLGALFGVSRLIVTPADDTTIPPTAAVMEDDDRYRERIQLSLEAYSTAGPYGAYLFYCLSASAEVKDVGVYGPESQIVDPGQVGIYVLSTEGNGTPDTPLLDIVAAALSPTDRRPLTDYVLVNPATITNYTVNVTLAVGNGPDPALIQQTAVDAIEAYVKARHAVGAKITRFDIAAATKVAGVDSVVSITSPSADLDPGLTGACFCTAITVTVETLSVFA